ncbi:GTPase [Isosphaeraceae bacterium EP7]
MLTNWRAWILALLLVGPFLAYLVFGSLWLFEHGWLLAGSLLWTASGVAFYALASRWTKATRMVLPPIDWEAPQTFSPLDRRAWEIVQEEAENTESVPMEQLLTADALFETGKALARRLAEHYNHNSGDLVETVPLVEMLAAVELAAEDLEALCRQVPGGDLLTSGHMKKAVVAAGYLQRANEIYGYLLPIFNPISGLPRLASQQLMVKPAWRDMQMNLLRWLYRAYVNRMGAHLVELYSGRLAIGTEKYRRLTRKHTTKARHSDHETLGIRLAVAGAKGPGAPRILAALKSARSGDPSLIKARLSAAGLDASFLDKLEMVVWVDVPYYTSHPGAETARDRSTRKEAVEAAVDVDALILVVEPGDLPTLADQGFAKAWDAWFMDHPDIEIPPALVVLDRTGMDDHGGIGEGQAAAYRTHFPPTFLNLLPLSVPQDDAFAVASRILSPLSIVWPRVERSALIRQLRQTSSRSKANRLLSQVGQQGARLWSHLRTNPKRTAGEDARR